LTTWSLALRSGSHVRVAVGHDLCRESGEKSGQRYEKEFGALHGRRRVFVKNGANDVDSVYREFIRGFIDFLEMKGDSSVSRE